MVVRLVAPRVLPEIDPVALRATGQRFLMHHRQRYLHALARLEGRKREILAALPMFFHCNHAALPGYLKDAPSGIWGHTPTGSDIAAIHRFARSSDTSLKSARQDIDAIYLMGSGGSLGHTADSDIDLWVVCDRRLHEALLPKLRAIENWSIAQGLAVQGFLVDPVFFRDPADTVHGPLLLDEFYRSGIHLCGKQPLWWYAAGTSEVEYAHDAEMLLDQRFVTHESILDFGAVGRPDLDALCSAGIAELRRALDTPHKSLLKLALVESYLNHPERPLLSSHYQSLMRQGTNDITRLDTYYMLFSYLTAVPSPRPSTFSIQDLSEMFVRKIVSRARELPRMSEVASEITRWGYTEEKLQFLRHPARMTLRETLTETGFACALIDKGIQFGRRLGMLSTLQRPALLDIESSFANHARPGDETLMPMNPALIPDIKPALEVRFVRHGWRLVEDGHPLRSGSSWMELLLWLTCNGITPRSVKLPTTWFEQAAQFWLQSTDRPFELLLFFNPMPDPNDEGDRIITAFDDPLSYSGFHICKARMVCCVGRTGDALHLTNRSGESGILESLLLAIDTSGPVVVAGAAFEDMLLVQRVETLLVDARRQLRETGSFGFPLGREHITLTRASSGVLSVSRHARSASLSLNVPRDDAGSSAVL